MSCRWKARSADLPQPRLQRGTIEPCPCARSASISKAVPTLPARLPVSACSIWPPRPRGAARRTAPPTSAGWPTSAGCTAASSSPPSKRSPAAAGRDRRAPRVGGGHRQRRRTRRARRGAGRGRPPRPVFQPLVAPQALTRHRRASGVATHLEGDHPPASKNTDCYIAPVGQERFGAIDFDWFHREKLPSLLECRGTIFPDADAAVLRPLCFRLSDGRAYTYVPDGGTFSVRPGLIGARTVVELAADAWCSSSGSSRRVSPFSTPTS